MSEQPEGTVPGAETAADVNQQIIDQAAQQQYRQSLGDFETELQRRMNEANAAFQAQSDQITAQLRRMQDQVQALRAQAGPPEPVVVAKSLAQRVASIAAANPDLGGAHFAGVVDQANRLSEAVQAAADGKGPVDEAARLAHAVPSWFTRVHQRASGKHLEGFTEVLNEAERIAEGLAELVPAAAGIAAKL
jgi:hypothetical protein